MDSLTRCCGMFFVPFDRSEVAFKISISFQIFRVSRLGVASLLCEWVWAIKTFRSFIRSPVLGSHYGAGLMQMLFWR
jgi:hypothetical protein